jgi:fucose permease
MGFTATGVGAAMPGALLPLLLHRWHLGDGRGGVLLFCYFLASTAGALWSGGAMNLSVARGAVLTAAGALWLGLASQAWGFAAIAVYGLGLGVAMTSTSLLVSRRFPAERRREMMRLNLLWAAGACAGPWLGLGGRALRAATTSSRPLLVLSGLAAFFAVWAMWAWLAEGEGARAVEGSFAADSDAAGEELARAAEARWTERWPVLAVPLPLLILVFCATGVESSTGGWVAAYAQRLGETVGATIGAATAFWAGLLGSRLVYSMRWTERLRERLVLGTSMLLIMLGLAVLVWWAGGGRSVVAAFAVGFGAGPVYPLLLAMVLRTREARGIFVVAGAGAACLPLLTGAVSGWMHSLAAGLDVPLAAATMMAVLSWRVKTEA